MKILHIHEIEHHENIVVEIMVSSAPLKAHEMPFSWVFHDSCATWVFSFIFHGTKAMNMSLI